MQSGYGEQTLFYKKFSFIIENFVRSVNSLSKARFEAILEKACLNDL